MATTNNIDNKRYQGLIISIALFLSLIGALLAFTFYTSSLLERNTALIDQTNQVANSAQAVIKDLFDLESSYGEDISSPHIQRVLTRLEENTALITNSLSAIEQGGVITDSLGNRYQLPNISNDARLDVAEAKEQWNVLEPKTQTYLKDANNIMVSSADELAQAVDQAKTSSLFINESLDKLTRDVFSNAERQATTIRLIQVLGVAAIFAYFLIFVFFFVRRLRETDAEALAARRETQEIMQTVNTGLFLLDKDLKIGQQHSRALNKIVGEENLAGENFTNVLRGRISDKDLNTTKQFIEQLYNPRVKEKLVDSLNPLTKVLLHNTSGTGSDSRFLDFKFSRVYEDKDIARILVNVNDVSDAVYLEQRLEKERSQNDMQIEMLTTILNVKPKVIHEFISNTKAHIEKMNNILKNPGSSQYELEAKLKAIYRDMHSLKGDASALKLHSFTKIASDAEDKLSALQNQGALSGNDFLQLAVHLDDLLSLSNTIEMLGERINQTSAASTKTAPTTPTATAAGVKAAGAIDSTPQASSQVIGSLDFDGGEDIDLDDESDSHLLAYYQDFAQDIASRQGKEVQLNSATLEQVQIPERLKKAVKEISIQLVRNAIVHGIEPPTDRRSAGKPSTGNLSLEMQSVGQDFIVSLQDDGQGIDYDSIRQKLVELGRFSLEEAEQLDRNQLLKQLFSSGFSTKDEADEDGGRGVGLDIIKTQVKESNGKLNVNSELGEMTRFVITLPKAS